MSATEKAYSQFFEERCKPGLSWLAGVYSVSETDPQLIALVIMVAQMTLFGPMDVEKLNQHISLMTNEKRKKKNLHIICCDNNELFRRELELVEDPPVELGGLEQDELEAMLRAPLDAAAP